MKIIGIGGSSHDFAACLLEDGQLKVAIEDERLSRVKHSLRLDFQQHSCRAVNYCLEAMNASEQDIDLFIGNDCVDPRYYRELNAAVRPINHHLAHAASAFYPAPYSEAAVLVIDGAGSFMPPNRNETMTYYFGRGNELKQLGKVSGEVFAREPEIMVENSIGLFYDILTWGLGFYGLNQGKTMGLAPYGSNKHVNSFAEFYEMEEGQFRQTREQVQAMKKFIRTVLYQDASLSAEDLFRHKADLAFAGQHHLERMVIEAARHLYRLTGSPHLCLAGGVALNSVANFKILENTDFTSVFVQPASGDAGTAIGAAYYAYYQIYGMERQVNAEPFRPYLGRTYSGEAIQEPLQDYSDRIVAARPDDIYEATAELLAQGKIIGWYQGSSEIGPRALGNRSILADARNPDMKDLINSRIKHREFFRPFAPIVLEGRQSEYFAMSHPSYYMLLVPPVQEGKRDEIPAVTHVDGTGRVQTVTERLNAPLHRLLQAFERRTGVPVLLNTSFNDNGEPIVETPLDAVRCFLNIDLDHLVMDGWLLSKSEKPAANRQDVPV